MNGRGESTGPRRLALVLPVLITVTIGAVLGGFVVVQNQREADRIGAADDVGSDYLSDVATYREEIRDRLTAQLEKSPKDPDLSALRKTLSKATASPPSLPTSDPVGMEESSTYAEAARTQRDLLEPYRQLARQLRDGEVAYRFVTAAQKVLRLRAGDYVDGLVLSSSAQVRTRLIPAFVAGRDEFAKVPVPKGQEKLAATVTSAAQTVIDRGYALANSIDAGRAYTFEYADEYQAAAKAVDDYATQVEGDVTEAIQSIQDLD